MSRYPPLSSADKISARKYFLLKKVYLFKKNIFPLDNTPPKLEIKKNLSKFVCNHVNLMLQNITKYINYKAFLAPLLN